MTLDEVSIDFENTFENGHAYVGLSRAKSSNSIRISNLTEEKIKANPK